MIVDPTLVERLAARVTDRLLHPPAPADPVITYRDPDTLRAAFDDSVPLRFLDAEPAHGADELLAATEQLLALSVDTSHPRFVNQNFAGPDPVGVVGDWIGAALNTTGATYEVAPVFTLMEHAVLDKLARLAGFPTAATPDDPPPGLFCPGGSVGLLFALQLARHRRDPDFTARGSQGEPQALFVSESGHYSVGKAAALLGIGTDAVTKVRADADGAMDPAALRAAIDTTIRDGRAPLAVIATAGTTVTSAFDPLAGIADVCREHGIWLHVDGAYGGSALLSSRERHRLDGLEHADSMVWDLHKMMGMTQQCSVLLVRNAAQLDECFASRADYLFQPDKRNATLDAGDRTFQCGRRVDVAKLWLSWKAHGDAGFAARVDHSVGLADHVHAHVEHDDAFAFAARGDFTNTCVLWAPRELRPLDPVALTEDVRARLHTLAPAVKARMQDDGTAMVGYQPLDGLNCFRLIFMSPRVTTGDADALLDLIDRYTSEVWAS